MENQNKWYNVLCTIILIGIVLFLNIGTVLIIRQNLNYLNYSLYLSYFCIPCFVLYIIHKFIKKERIKVRDIFIIALVIFAYLSYKHAFNPTIALEGTYGRNEGLKVILTYYSIFLLSCTLPEKYQKHVMQIFLITGVFQIIVGTIQTLGITNILGYSRLNNFSTRFHSASGTFGNPNFYSTYILMCLMYTFGLLINSKSKKSSIFNFILFVVFAYGLVIGNTMSCMIAALVVGFIFLISKIRKNNIKKITIGFLSFIIVGAIGIYILDGAINKRITFTLNKNIAEIKDILKNGITDSTGNNRVHIWKETVKFIPRYKKYGIGIDNFIYINYGTYLCAGEGDEYECFDKAHNESLQFLITQGVYAFIVYCILILFTIIEFFKNKRYKNDITMALFLSFIAYLIQAQLNISVITVAPMFYMIMGFIHFKEKDNRILIEVEKNNNKTVDKDDFKIEKSTIVTLFVILILTIIKCIFCFG